MGMIHMFLLMKSMQGQRSKDVLLRHCEEAVRPTKQSTTSEIAPSAKTRTDPSLGGQGLSRSYGIKSIDEIASALLGSLPRNDYKVMRSESKSGGGKPNA